MTHRFIVRLIAVAALLVPLAAQTATSTARAQTAAAVQATCDRHLTPASSKPSKNAPKGVKVDCGCIAGYLVGRFGAGDAEVIVRLFAAGAAGSDQELEAVTKAIGLDRIRAVLGKVGKFQELGRQTNEVCPETKNQ
jgi:hypothetical protein